MQTAVFLSLLGVCSAFVTPSMPRTRGVARMAVNDLIGADVETGGVWDPLGLSKDEASLYRNRATELKQGRVAMVSQYPSFHRSHWLSSMVDFSEW